MKKYCLLFSIVCLYCTSAAAREVLSENEIRRLQDLTSITAVEFSTIRGDDFERIESLKFNTYQDEQAPKPFTVRVTVELIDRSNKTFFAQIMRSQGRVSSEYTGEDFWEFRIPYGELSDPLVRAHVIEYGILHDGELLVIASDKRRADRAEEITERSEGPIGILFVAHLYYYRDNDEILQAQSD